MIRPNKRRFTIGSYLLSGFLPWGRDFTSRNGPPSIGRCPAERGGFKWPLCCGHVLTDREVADWIAEGLMAEGEPGPNGNRCVIAGPNLESWISAAWHDMTVARWAKKPAEPKAYGA